MAMASFYSMIFCLIFWSIYGIASAKLSSTYYDKSCPKLLPTVQAGVRAAINKETRMGASLLRLQFHDCFVNGCDASLLLDDNSTFVGEKTAAPNLNSVHGFHVIDGIKTRVEKVCPSTVSCADILALAARDSVVALGGPSWTVPLGRRDSVSANRALANTSIPPPTSNLSQLIRSFSNQGLSVKDLVSLSGVHTIGYARCITFRRRIYNDTNINAAFAKSLQARCPRIGSNNTLARLDRATPAQFDNYYFHYLLSQKGLLHSDQQLFNGGSTDSLVNKYVSTPSVFTKDFAESMVKMGNIKPLTGSNGEIRINCRKAN